MTADLRTPSHVGLLGPVIVVTDTGEIPVTSPRLRALLTSLTLAHPRAVAVDRLVDDVWPDRPPRNPAAALQTQVSRLRSAIGSAAVEGVAGGYRLRLADPASDLAIVERSGHTAETALWRGEPGADLPVGPLRDRLVVRTELARRSILERRWEHWIDTDPARAVSAIGEARTRDPLDEHLAALHMRACIASGDPNRALRIHADIGGRLAEELGADPGPELTAAHAAALGYAPVPRTPAPAPNPYVAAGERLAGLRAAVHPGGVITVIGPGGIGKSRLVAEFVSTTTRPDAFFEFSGAQTAQDIAATVAGGLRRGAVPEPLRSTGPDDPAAAGVALAGLLADGSLVILDSCEHVAAAVADLVGALIMRRSDITVIATSSVPLDLPSERLVTVSSMPVDDAVTLFCTRARAVRSDAILDPRLVTELCRRLDGSPLALELAAAQLRHLALADVVARLDERFDLLAVPGDGRHNSLADVVRASWEVLSPNARSTLGVIAWFPADFRLADALPLAGVTRTGLAELCDHSLLRVIDGPVPTPPAPPGTVRGPVPDPPPATMYRISETVRDFARDRIAEDPAHRLAIHRSYAEWACATLDGIVAGILARRIPVREAATLLDEQSDVLLGVLDVAAHRDTHPIEASTVARLLPVVAWRWIRTGGHPDTGMYARIAVDAPTDASTITGRCFATLFLAALDRRRDAARSRAALRRAASQADLDPLRHLAAGLLTVPPRHLPRFLTAAARSTDRRAVVVAELIRTDLAERAAAVHLARRSAMRALTMATLGGRPWLAATARHRMGNLCAMAGDHRTAAVHFEQSAAEFSALGFAEDACRVRIHHALARSYDAPDFAAAELDACLRDAGDTPRPYLATAHAALAQLCVAGDPAGAHAHADTAVAIAGPPRDAHAVHLHAVRIGVFSATGADVEARVAADTLLAALGDPTLGRDVAHLPALGAAASAFALVNADDHTTAVRWSAAARGSAYRRDFAVLDLPPGPSATRGAVLDLLGAAH